MKRTIIALAVTAFIAGCRGEDAQQASSHWHDPDRCSGILAGWHKIGDYGGGELPARNVLILKKEGTTTWNGFSAGSSALTEIYRRLPTFPGPDLEFVVEPGADCGKVKDLRSKFDPVCHLGSRCFEFSVAELNRITPPPLPPKP
jgi:hypothetical protein